MINRYASNSTFPQPIRKVIPSVTDQIHTLKMGERLDNIAYKYYGDPGLSWIIMCANPEFDNELDITIGTQLRIPYPLNRVLDDWMINKEI